MKNHTLENSSSHDWLDRSFLVNIPIWTEKEITYHWTNDSSNTLASVKKTRSLNNLFIFREPEKGLKRTPWGFFTQCHFLQAWKDSEMDSTIFSCLRNLKEDVKIRLHDVSLHNVVFYDPGKKLELDSKLWY